MDSIYSYEKKDDGSYTDEKGIEYCSLEQFLHSGILGFCGCGPRERNLMMVYNLLKLLKESSAVDGISLGMFYRDVFKRYAQDNWEPLLHFFWYVMDSREITDHGTHIPGWLEDYNFFEALSMWVRERGEDKNVEG